MYQIFQFLLQKIKIKRNFVLIFVASIICFFVLLFFADKITEKIVHKNKEVNVPDLITLPIDKVDEILKKIKLNYVIESEIYDIKIASGCVISQLPIKDTIVRQGRVIKLIISRGGNKVEVPLLISMPQRIAELTIKNSALVVGQEEYAYSLIMASGRIMQQKPAANSLVIKDSMVNLKISKGSPPDNIKLMPLILNMTLDESTALLTQNEINFVINEVSASSDVPKNTVVKQNPEVDEVLKKNSKVILEIAV